MPKNDGKLGGGFLRQTVLGSGVSLMLVLGKGVANRGREMVTCIDITTMTKMDVVVTTPSPNTKPALGKIGASPKYKAQILQYLTGETSFWTKKQRKAFEKTILPHLTYAIVGFRGYDQVPYVMGFLKARPVNQEGGTSRDKDKPDGSDGPEKLNKPRLCTGLDNFLWHGGNDIYQVVIDTAGDAGNDGQTAAGFIARDNGRMATVGTHNIWMHLTNPISNRWANHHTKKKGKKSYHAPVLHIKKNFKASTGVVNWDKNKMTDVGLSTIRQSGYYRFSAGYDCATWERALYGRRTVAYLGRLASQLRRLAGLVSVGFGVMLENFRRTNRIKIYNPKTVAEIKKPESWTPITLSEITSGIAGVSINNALPEWIFNQHACTQTITTPTTVSKQGHMPQFADGVTYYLPEEACDPTRIVPPLEQALCCEYIRMTDFGGLNRFLEADATNRIGGGFFNKDFLTPVSAAGVIGQPPITSEKLLAWRMRNVKIDVKMPATGTQAGSANAEGEGLSANITGTPKFQEGGEHSGLKVREPQDLYTAGKTAYEQGCRLGSVGPKYTEKTNGKDTGGEVKVPDYKKVTGRLNGSLTYLHYHNVEGHHGDPMRMFQTEKRAGDWNEGVWNFARGYYQNVKFKK